MNRILALILALALCLSLTACGGSGKTAEADTAPVDTDSTAESPADAEEAAAAPDAAEATAAPDAAAPAVSLSDLNVGDSFTMGTFADAPLSWTVINKGVGTALVLCDNALERTTFDENHGKWKDSAVRTYLNGTFADTVFTPEEAEQIVEVENTTVCFDFDSYTDYEEQSMDRVFLLSRREFNLYVTPLEDLRYGIPIESIKDDVYLADVTNSSAVAQACSWELRDDGEQDAGSISSVTGWDGTLSMVTGKTDLMTLRPAMWIYTDREVADSYRAGETALPADETLNTYLASLHKGDEATFGRFDNRDYRDGNQAIRWTVMDETDESLLLYSCESFGREQFAQNEDESMTWADSDLRALLNSDHFINLYFTAWERSKICLTHNETSDGDPEWGREGGADTDDYLFLPDREELLSYCPKEADRVVEEVDYWLRSPNFAPGYFSMVNIQGDITQDDATSRHEIRVAMWVEK